MTIQTKNPPGGESDGPLECQLLAGVDTQEANQNRPPPQDNLLRNPRAVREAKLELTRDLLHEALGWARIYAATAQTFAEIGDDTGALFSLGQFHKAASAACQAGRLIREGRGEAASNKDGDVAQRIEARR